VPSAKHPRPPWIRKLATLLASSGIAPFSLLFIAPFSFAAWSYLLRGPSPTWTSPWPLYTIVPTIALFGSPFLYVSIRTLLATRKHCTMDLAAMQAHQLFLWLTLALIGQADFDEPPRKLLFPNEIIHPVVRFIAQGANFVGAFIPVAFWAS